MAYVWGWPLVNKANRAVAFSKAPEPGLLGGVMPVAYRAECDADRLRQRETDLRRLPEPGRRLWRRLLRAGQGAHVIQVPDFGDRFWVYPLYDARTDEFSEIGKQYGTKPGFYMIVGPNWKGETPAGITAVVRSSTALVFAIPRIFMDDTAEDRKAIQPVLNQIVFYPLSEFDGKMKTKDWSKLPHFPGAQVQWLRRNKVGEPGDLLRRVTGGDQGACRRCRARKPSTTGSAAVLEAASKGPGDQDRHLKETAVAADAN